MVDQFRNPFVEVGLSPVVVKAAGWANSLDLAKQAFKLSSRYRHPDMGGNASDFSRLEEAMSLLQDPDTRREFFEEMGSLNSKERTASYRTQINDLKRDLLETQSMLNKAILAPHALGSLQHLLPGTALVVPDARNRNEHWLLRVDKEGVLTRQFLREHEQAREPVLSTFSHSGRVFIEILDGEVHCWDQSQPTSAENGLWLVAPHDASTETQNASRLETVGKPAIVDFVLVCCIIFETGGQRRSTAVAQALNTAQRMSLGSQSISAQALAQTSVEALRFEPTLGARLVIADTNKHFNAFEIVGNIIGGVIPTP